MLIQSANNADFLGVDSTHILIGLLDSSWSNAIDSNEASCGFRIIESSGSGSMKGKTSSRKILSASTLIDWVSPRVKWQETWRANAALVLVARAVSWRYEFRECLRERKCNEGKRQNERKEQTLKSFMSPSLDLSLSCGILVISTAARDNLSACIVPKQEKRGTRFKCY